MSRSKEYASFNIGSTHLHYYQFKMDTNSDNNYCSHVFFTEPVGAEILHNSWEEITSVIAVQYQSEIEPLIERSNFYIFFFIYNEIDDELRSKIEGNDFCARKYVISKSVFELEDVVSEINKKLFGTSFETEIKTEHNLHVNSLTLKNFRVYKKEFSIDFRNSVSDLNENEETASFVMIYAKNGVGKTSIFDGIEYLLKGEVERIITLQEMNKYSSSPNTTYHNLKDPYGESVVSAVLSNGETIERAVGRTKNNDLMHNRPRKGRDFIGSRAERDKWKELILPHDSIDGFILANNPETLYMEWISHSNLQKESEAFLKKNEEKMKIKSDLDKLQKRQESLRQELKRMEKGSDYVEEVIKHVVCFNRVKESLGYPEGQDLKLSKDDGIEAYIALKNTARVYLRMVNDHVNEHVLTEKDRLLTFIKHGKNYYKSKHLEYLNVSKKKKEFQIKKEDRRKYEEKIFEMSLINKKRDELERERSLLIYLAGQGGSLAIRKKYEQIIGLRQKSVLWQEYIERKNRELQKLTDRYNEIKISSDSINKILNDEDKYYVARTNAEKYASIKESSKSIGIQIESLENEILTLELSANYYWEEEIKLGEIDIPDSISDLKAREIRKCGELFGDEYKKHLFDLRNEYMRIKSRIYELDLELEHSRNNTDELHRLISLAESYVLAHPEKCNCPVCGKHFRSYRGLCNAIRNSNSNRNEKLIEEVRKYRNKALESEHTYSEDVRHIQKAIAKRKSELSVKLNDVRTKMATKNHEVSELKNKLTEQKEELVKIGKLLCQFGKNYEDTPIESVEEWYNNKSNELVEKNKQKDEINKLIKSIKDEMYLINDSRNKAENELKLLETDEKLQESIGYVISKGQTWSDETAMIYLENSLCEVEEKYKKLFQELDCFANVKHLDAEYISAELDKCSREIGLLEKEEAIYKDYFRNETHLEEKIDSLTRHEKMYKDEIEYLNRIIEEHGAKLYFSDYKKKARDYKDACRRIVEEESKFEACKAEIDVMKKQLEVDLKEHFNQTVMNQVYCMIDPHHVMKNVKYTIEFSKDDKPMLYISVNDGENDIRPEWYFSTAQLNSLVFSAFFSRALRSQLPLKTIFVDDPISHFDDMNILGFADLMRYMITKTPFQFIMSTHDRKIYNIMKRKLPPDYYKTKYIEL